jgi:hypothetical protein
VCRLALYTWLIPSSFPKIVTVTLHSTCSSSTLTSFYSTEVNTHLFKGQYLPSPNFKDHRCWVLSACRRIAGVNTRGSNFTRFNAVPPQHHLTVTDEKNLRHECHLCPLAISFQCFRRLRVGHRFMYCGPATFPHTASGSMSLAGVSCDTATRLFCLWI